MYCSNCGKENKVSAKFCAYCGAALYGEIVTPKAAEESQMTETESQGQPTAKKDEITEISELPAGRPKKIRVGIYVIIAIIVLAAAASIAGILVFRNIQENQQYKDSIASGDRYLEELDYENAEAFYLDAISIDPKQKEPYKKLIDTYIGIEDSTASSLDGKRIKVTGDLSQSPGTAYYWSPYVIWNAVVVPEEEEGASADGEKNNAIVTEDTVP